VPDALAMLPLALRSRLQVTQQCRPEDIEAVRKRYADHGIPAELGTYFEDMADRLADTHLFVGRAGASTIAELTAVGRPAILVPYPHATADHQTGNARWLSEAGAAIMIRDDELTPERLRELVGALLAEPERLEVMGQAARTAARPDAAERIADMVESVALR